MSGNSSLRFYTESYSVVIDWLRPVTGGDDDGAEGADDEGGLKTGAGRFLFCRGAGTCRFWIVT